MEWDDICPPWWKWPWPWPPPRRWGPEWRDRMEEVRVEIPRDGEIAGQMFRSLTVLAISHTMTGEAALLLRQQAVKALNLQMQELNEVDLQG